MEGLSVAGSKRDPLHMIDAGGFFGSRELNSRLGLVDADSFWEWCRNPTIGEDLEEFGVEPPVFRGQSDQRYGLSSSLFRQVKKVVSGRVTELHLAQAERAVLSKARDQGLGRNMTDGELLMVLQHHQVPTRLIDVSTHAKEAVFFATETKDATDGRLFLIARNERGIGRDVSLLGQSHTFSGSTVDELQAWQQLPWHDAVVGVQRAKQDWTSALSIVADPALDPRMRAQQGRFLLGGLVARYRGMSLAWNNQRIAAESWPDISTLAIFFPRSPLRGANQYWGAIGWTVRIKAQWKPQIRRKLANLVDPISTDSMYPPLGELRRLLVDQVSAAVA